MKKSLIGLILPSVMMCLRRRRDVAQLGRAPRLGRGGRTFKSCHPDHFKRTNFQLVLFLLGFHDYIVSTHAVFYAYAENQLAAFHSRTAHSSPTIAASSRPFISKAFRFFLKVFFNAFRTIFVQCRYPLRKGEGGIC